MASEIVVKNTLAFQFPGNAAQPTVVDMGRFIKTLNGDRSMLDTAYKISDEKSVYIRYKSEDAMKFCLANNETTLPFRYTDGKEVMVKMSVAGDTRYVRVFDLPPEVTDADLSSVLEKYGSVKRIVRERFPAEIGLDIFSGVRGLYMDIQREIPEFLFFRGRKGRLYYQGVKPRCYICKSDSHLKKACPVFRARHEAEDQPTQQSEKKLPAAAARSLDEGTGEATAPVSPVKATPKQHSKTKNRKITENKRQLSVESAETSSQPQQKKKTIPESENESSMVTVEEGNGSDYESDNGIDWETSTLEEQQAWVDKKREREKRIRDRKIEIYLGKQ